MYRGVSPVAAFGVPIFAKQRPIKNLAVTICTEARIYWAKFRKIGDAFDFPTFGTSFRIGEIAGIETSEIGRV